MQILSRSGGECVLKCNNTETVAVNAEDGQKVKVKGSGRTSHQFCHKKRAGFMTFGIYRNIDSIV